MPRLDYWQDEAARESLMARGRERFRAIESAIEDDASVVAIEVESGDHFCAPTLGKANDLAFQRYPDCWLYFCRVDDPSAEMLLPTW
jgi:hypothetical protein